MDAQVFENINDETDAYGLPPHSIEAVVYGGLETDIAQQIFDRAAGGIRTFGQVSVPVIMANGDTTTICFSRPRPVQVYVQVINLVTSSNFPHDGNNRLVAAIVNYIGSQEAGGVGVGETLYHQRIPAVLYTVPGVLDFDILLGTSPDDLQEQNIEVDSRSKVVTEEGMVSIA